MAYLQQDKDDKEKVQGLNEVMAPQEGQAPTAAASSQPTPAAPQASSAPAAAQPGQVNQKAGSGTFTNLKNYLTANQGNRIASAATQKVSNLATGAQKGITQASTGFGQKVEQGTLANREQAVQDVAATTAAARGVEAIAPTVKTAPQVEGDKVQSRGVEQYQEQLGDKYNQFKDEFDALNSRQWQTNATPPGQESPVAQAHRELREKYGITQTVAPVTPVAPTAPIEQAQPQYLDDAQQKRFADIINAKYAGPESLRQSGLLQPAAEKVTTAARQIKNAETAGGREELLRSMYGKNRDYTQGQSKLDALLLNTSGQGVSQLQEAAKAGGNLQQTLQQAEAGSQNLAQNRAQEISGIREKARETFGAGRTEEETATEKRMTDLIETPVLDEAGNPVLKQDGTPMTEWDRLPEHFRNSLANKAAGTKKVKEEQLAAINTQYAPQIKAMTDANKQMAATQAKIDKLSSDLRRMRVGSATFGSGYTRPSEKKLAEIDRIKNSMSVLGQQYANQKAEVAALQKTPEYQQYAQQKSAADKMNMNQWALSPEEAAVLGVSAGEGLYNIGQGDIRTVAADREKLITQNEFARQQALSQLAGLDLSKGLQKELKYKDQSKAGTQDLTKSLDTESFRNLLNEAQQGFKQSAEGANLTGTGSKKVSRGNWLGKKTSTYHATAGGNVADMLRQGGYDVGAEGSEARSLLSDKDMLANYLDATRNNTAMEANIGGSTLEGTAAGASTGASIGSMFGGVGAAPGAAIGAAIGGTIGSNTLDPLQSTTDLYKDLESKLGIKGAGAIGQGIQDARSVLASPITGLANMGGSSVVGDVFRGIAGTVGGINTGAMKEFGDAIAKQKAREDLQRKYASYLKGQGFENRANIADTETTRARTAALNQLLQRKG